MSPPPPEETPLAPAWPLRARSVARAVGLYVLLTVALTWPLALNLRVVDPGDSAFFAWEIGWELHALFSDPAQLPHANIYHPARFTLGMDEPVLGTTLVVAPLFPFTRDAVLLFNLARLLTFVLSALTAWLLARELGCGEAVALAAGGAFAFSPIRTDQIGHLSTLGSQWLPLVLLFLLRFARSGRSRHALLAGLFYVLAFHACGYHGLLGALLLPVVALPLLWGRWERLPRAVPAALLAGVALVPLYLMHRGAMDPTHFVRGREEAVLYSASLESFLATSPWNRVWGDATAEMRTFSNNLFPGLLILLLVGGAALGLRRARQRPSREAWAFFALAAGSVLVALGPEVRLFGHVLCPAPLGLVREILPVFTRIRAASRAGIYLDLALAMLLARALERLRLRPLALAGAAAVVLLEGLVAPIPSPAWMRVVDTSRPLPPVYAWLRDQPGEFAVVELPILESDGLFRRPAYDESIYMVWSTWHWKRLVNGYAGVEPQTYRDARAVARRFPSAESLATFRSLGVRYLVLHQGGYGPNQWARVERDLPRFAPPLVEVAQFGGDRVYALSGEPGTP